MLGDFPIRLPAYIVVQIDEVLWRYMPTMAFSVTEPCAAIFEDEHKAVVWRDAYVGHGSIWEVTGKSVERHLEVFTRNGIHHVAVNPFDDIGPATQIHTVTALLGTLRMS